MGVYLLERAVYNPTLGLTSSSYLAPRGLGELRKLRNGEPTPCLACPDFY